MEHPRTTVAARGFLLICVLIVGQSFTFAESSLKATPDHYDFGTIAEEDNAVVTTIIQNIGSTPIEITNVRTS